MYDLSLSHFQNLEFDDEQKVKLLVRAALKRIFSKKGRSIARIRWKPIWQYLASNHGMTCRYQEWKTFHGNFVQENPKGGIHHVKAILFWMGQPDQKVANSEKCQAEAKEICVNLWQGRSAKDQYKLMNPFDTSTSLLANAPTDHQFVPGEDDWRDQDTLVPRLKVISCESSPPIAILEDPGFTQVANPAEEFELIFRLIFQYAEKVIDGEFTLLGLKEARCEIVGEGCHIEERYFSSERDLGLRLMEGENKVWRVTGPLDAFGFLGDQIMRDPICFGRRTEASRSRLSIRVFARKFFFDIDQPLAERLSDTRANLINRMLKIYLLDKDHRATSTIDLCWAVIEW